MALFKDPLGNTICFDKPPTRIISLVPSQTELLFDFGLNEEVVGITKFCIHPNEWFRTKVRVGGTKTVVIDKVRRLKPDLILANKEENVKEQIQELSDIAPVYTTDISTFEDALEMITQVGKLVGKEDQSKELVEKIRTGFANLNRDVTSIFPQATTHLKTAYLIWKDPYMVAGGDTYINDLLNHCGLTNIFRDLKRYPAVTIEQLKTCELLILSSEPYPFKQKHIDELQHDLPNCKIILADGEMFSWYGSRLLKAALYFQQLIKEVNA